MRLMLGTALAALVVVAPSPAGAATVKLLDPAAHSALPVSPQVEFNSTLDSFLVVAHQDFELRSRRSGLKGNGRGPWTLPSTRLDDFQGGDLQLVYNRWARQYLVRLIGDSFLRLDHAGRVLAEGWVASEFGANILAVTPVTGTPNWFAYVEDCKYNCLYSGQVIGPQGELVAKLDLTRAAPIDVYSVLERRWQVGYEPGEKTFLLVWESGYQASGDSRSRTIYAQRFGLDGGLVGERLEIASHQREASQPHMAYHPQREEWLIVYRRGKNVKARFLRGSRLSKPFRIGQRWRPGIMPAVAYSPWRDRYLVTWVQWGQGSGIYGRWLQSNGRAVGARFAVNDPPGDQYVLDSGYSACNHGGACLVIWINDGEGGTVRGQYLRVR